MMVTHVNGVDPGLVHTGVVGMTFNAAQKKIIVRSVAIAGLNEQAVAQWVNPTNATATFIEAYRPRSNLNSDKRMVEGVARIKAALPGSVVLNNTSVKKVVKKSLMELLGVWSFPTVTHHQDLRSAARIGLLGMMKDPVMNQLLADIVRDHLAGSDWHVVV